jgi:hypothetical protein
MALELQYSRDTRALQAGSKVDPRLDRGCRRGAAFAKWCGGPRRSPSLPERSISGASSNSSALNAVWLDISDNCDQHHLFSPYSFTCTNPFHTHPPSTPKQAFFAYAANLSSSSTRPHNSRCLLIGSMGPTQAMLACCVLTKHLRAAISFSTCPL